MAAGGGGGGVGVKIFTYRRLRGVSDGALFGIKSNSQQYKID